MDKPASLRGGRRRRCAIYTRKSSEEGLEQQFNSLHAQREACEAFITSQRHEGWICLPQAYDDGGLSRLNTQPIRTPVNASPSPSRGPTHDSGTV